MKTDDGVKKKLYKSEKDKVLCGVCGGIGEYLNIDPVIIRLIWVFISLCWGAGILLYIIACFIIPKKPTSDDKNNHNDEIN